MIFNSKLVKGQSLFFRCFRGGAVLGVGTAVERGMRFVINMILARLLAPDQFGLMALVFAAIGLYETLTEVGVRQSVIQNKNGEAVEFLNVAWWFSSIRGAVLYFIGILTASQVAGFYNEPSLAPMLRVAFLTMLFQGLTNPNLYVLEKRMQFGRYVWIVQGSAILGNLICIGMAFCIPNVWALVVGVVAQAFLRCVGSFVLCPFRLSFQFDRSSWNEIFRFSRRMAGLPILTYLFTQADILVMGKMVNADILGMYSLVLSLVSIPKMLFTNIANPLILPVLAAAQDSQLTLQNHLLKMTRLLFLFGLPIATCLAVFSGSILTVVYGEQYTQVSLSFSILCFYVLIYLSGALIVSVYLALGRPDVHRYFTIIRVVLMGLFLYPAIVWFGPTGAAAARLLCLILPGIVQQINLSRLINLSLLQYILTLKEGVLLSIVIFPVSLYLRNLSETPIIQIVIAAGLCVLVWLYILWGKRESIRNLFIRKNSSTAI